MTTPPSDKEKLPSISVIVPVVVFFNNTLAPIIGDLSFESSTVPLTYSCAWAKPVQINNKRNKKNYFSHRLYILNVTFANVAIISL